MANPPTGDGANAPVRVTKSARRVPTDPGDAPTSAPDFLGDLPASAPVPLTTVLVIDRKALTRDCLVAAFTEHPFIDFTLSASDPEEAARTLDRDGDIDAALVNLGADPFDVRTLSDLRERLQPLLTSGRIAIMCSASDDPHLLAALQGGVAGFLPSDTPLDVTAKVLHLVGLGWTVYPRLTPALFATRPEHLKDEAPLAQPDLSSRQRQVLNGILGGLTNRSIGTRLGISERAVKAHVQQLMRHLNVSNRTQIVAKLAGLNAQAQD